MVKKFTVSYTIKKNNKGITTGKFKKQFRTRYGAQKFITEIKHSQKREWYKYAVNIRSNA